MSHSKHILIHDFEDSRALVEVTTLLWLQASRMCPSAKAPKLRNHVTILPPFLASDEVAFAICMATDIAWPSFLGEHENVQVSHHPEFFKNKDSDVLHLPVIFPLDYQRLVESYRKNIKHYGVWVHELPSKKWNPHITIAEGVGLADKLESTIEKNTAGRTKTSLTLPFNKPKLLKKEDSGVWEEVVFE